MKRNFGLVILILFFCFYTSSAKADIEVIQAVITTLGDVVEDAKEATEKLKSYYTSVQELATQAKKFAKDAKDTINEVKKTAKTAKERAQDIKSKVESTLKVLESGDVKAILSKAEFSGLKGMFDGTKIDDEMSEAIMDTMVRKQGDDSIANQKALEKGINLKQGVDMANLFGEAFALRQQLKDEEDDPQTSESIDESIEAYQKVLMQSMKRKNKILEMDSGLAAFHHAFIIGNYQSTEGDDDDE